jgi:hypothetical protein
MYHSCFAWRVYICLWSLPLVFQMADDILVSQQKMFLVLLIVRMVHSFKWLTLHRFSDCWVPGSTR